MVRVKIVRDHPQYRVGETVFVSRNVAHGLIDGGFGVISKDMSARDINVAQGGSVRPRKPAKRLSSNLKRKQNNNRGSKWLT